MFITVGENTHELKTTLGVGKRLENKFKQPVGQIFNNLESALTDELIGILSIAADKVNDASFVSDIEENWDYTDLYGAVQDLILRLMYSGTPEQQEAKIAKSPAPEQQKNMIRGLLGLPIPTAPGSSDEI